jgi:hypothetical protein
MISILKYFADFEEQLSSENIDSLLNEFFENNYHKNIIYIMYFNKLTDKFPLLKDELIAKFELRKSFSKDLCDILYKMSSYKELVCFKNINIGSKVIDGNNEIIFYTDSPVVYSNSLLLTLAESLNIAIKYLHGI